MVGASLKHCKKMGTEPGRRLLEQRAAKLEPVIAVNDFVRLVAKESTRFDIGHFL